MVSSQVLSEKDMVTIKDICLQYWQVVKNDVRTKNEDRLILARCYTQAVLDVLKSKGILDNVVITIGD